jgi:phthiocerol/phenolphthiocerol synthesis type-I polyketide synthase E
VFVSNPQHGNEIAIVGIAGRFPGAADLAELWQNLCDGVEAVQRFTDDELAARGVPAQLLRDPSFVKAAASVADPALFDAALFGYTPREAELIDPQHRLFLECALEALEDAGHAAADPDVLVGVFGGAALSSYLVFNLLSNPALVASLDPLQINLGNANSFLTTRASYKLDLKGPSVSIESACSTSLVAIHFACQSLLGHECDLALAGGVSINLGVQHGYRYIPGSILSPEGTCRPFDAGAGGIVFGSGAGVVALRRLADALADGDAIYAVIRGSAVNNDGAARAGYTAPGVAGQAQVIAEALANADVPPETIRYVEAHGTGTALGDPIEIEALTRAYRASTAATQYCGIGSLKANLGHLDVVSGVAGLIKVALALRHRLLPPSIHCEVPNPAIDWAASPFFVATQLTPLSPGEAPVRAAVSSFGMGGTNAHAILEEPPVRAAAPAGRAQQLLVVSAATATALDAASARLAQHLRGEPDAALADVAFSLQVGRRRYPHRRAVVCDSVADAIAALDPGAGRALTGYEPRTGRPVVFMFPGQGSQHAAMAAGLYAREPVFRSHIDDGSARLAPILGIDPRAVLFPAAGAASPRDLTRTELAQPLLFLVEHALAQLWMSWGVAPEAMIGHSVGEYVAACLAGVVTVRDALGLVAARGRLMQSLPPGDMISVNLPEAELARLISPPLAIAGVNGPALCVASGPADAIAALEQTLAARNIGARRLHTSHAFHSPLVEPILEAFAAELRRIPLAEPRIAWLSGTTGTWITPGEARDPAYWVRQLRQPVRFADGIAALAARPERVLLEVGPGQALATFARQCPGFASGADIVASLPHPRDASDDHRHALGALARLWLAGVDIDWRATHGDDHRLRVPLPTYPFERQRYWISPGHGALTGVVPAAPVRSEPEATAAISAAAATGLHPRPGLRTAFVAPRSDLERAVAGVWQDVLGIADLGVDDNFFELGGHSLLATALVGRLRERLGLEIPLQALFDAQTVARMAEVVTALHTPARRDDPSLAALLAMLAELADGDPANA